MRWWEGYFDKETPAGDCGQTGENILQASGYLFHFRPRLQPHGPRISATLFTALGLIRLVRRAFEHADLTVLTLTRHSPSFGEETAFSVNTFSVCYVTT